MIKAMPAKIHCTAKRIRYEFVLLEYCVCRITTYARHCPKTILQFTAAVTAPLRAKGAISEQYVGAMVMKTPRGMPVRTLPPKSIGRFPWEVDEAGEEKY